MASKVARVCDVCLQRRARWCCSSDTSVYSVSLMLRHERVPLRPTSLSLGCRSSPAGETITGVLIPYSQAKSLLSRRRVVPEASDRDLPEEQK